MKLKNWQISSPVLAIQTAVQGGYWLCCFLIWMLVTQVYLLCKNHWVTQFCMCVVFQQKVHYNEKKITKKILCLWHLATLFVKFVCGGGTLWEQKLSPFPFIWSVTDSFKTGKTGQLLFKRSNWLEFPDRTLPCSDPQQRHGLCYYCEKCSHISIKLWVLPVQTTWAMISEGLALLLKNEPLASKIRLSQWLSQDQVIFLVSTQAEGITTLKPKISLKLGLIQIKPFRINFQGHQLSNR